MENASEALKMAGSVLLFVIALSIAMLTFSQARETINIVLQHADRSGFTDTYIGTGSELENTFYYTDDTMSADQGGTLERYVGLETIIPTAYRETIESFRIDFKGLPDGVYVYKQFNPYIGSKGAWEEINYIDTVGTRDYGYDEKHNEIQTVGQGVGDKKDFIEGILFNSFNTSDENKNFLSPEEQLRGTKRGRYPFHENPYKNLVDFIQQWLDDRT